MMTGIRTIAVALMVSAYAPLLEGGGAVFLFVDPLPRLLADLPQKLSAGLFFYKLDR